MYKYLPVIRRERFIIHFVFCMHIYIYIYIPVLWYIFFIFYGCINVVCLVCILCCNFFVMSTYIKEQ